jgi:hypothetical protein
VQAGVGKWRSFMRGDEGSVTLEASMVFPWVFILTFLLILFSVVLTRHVLTYYSASEAVERAAFTWSNSAKDLRTGVYPKGRYDGLYWRLSDDYLLAGLFGWNADQRVVRIPIAPGPPSSDGFSAEDKLRRTGHSISVQMKGTLGYRNSLWKREISIETADSQVPQALRTFRRTVGRNPEADVSAVIVEPAEIIRSFDLVRYYKAKMNGKGEGAAGYRAKAAAVLDGKR